MEKPPFARCLRDWETTVKTYVVMIDYGAEGWKIWAETDDFSEAVAKRDDCMGLGSGVVIFKPVELVITEKAA